MKELEKQNLFKERMNEAKALRDKQLMLQKKKKEMEEMNQK